MIDPYYQEGAIRLSIAVRPQRGFLAMTERGAEVPSAYPIEVLGTRTVDDYSMRDYFD